MARYTSASLHEGRSRRLTAAALVSSFLTYSSGALAEDTGPAEELYRLGLVAKEAGQARAACRLFDESLRDWEDPRPLFQVARCRMDEGNDLEAWRAYKRVAKYARERERKTSLLEAMTAIAEIEPRLARLRVVVPSGKERAEGIRVRLDDASLSLEDWNDALALPAGVHRVEADAPGRVSRTWSVEVSPGSVVDVVVVLDQVAPAPLPPPQLAPCPPPVPTEPIAITPPRAEGQAGARASLSLVGFGSVGLLVGAASGQLASGEPSERGDLSKLSWGGIIFGSAGLAAGLTLLALRADDDETAVTKTSLGWMLLGGGGAGLLGGAAAGVMGLGAQSDLASACPTGACPPEQQGNVDAYGRLRAVSAVSLVAGGALLGAGGFVLLLSDPAPGEARAPHNTSSYQVAPYLAANGVGLVGAF